MTTLCKFTNGACIHCGDIKQGACEGWNAPPPDCRTCEHKPMYARDNALCYRVNCVNGNEYVETRKVVLWRTET